MDRDKLVGHILVGLPIFHILCAATFLFAYCVGFGANIASLITLSDLFTTSINNMVVIYLFAIGLAFTAFTTNIIVLSKVKSFHSDSYGKGSTRLFDTFRKSIIVGLFVLLLSPFVLALYCWWYGLLYKPTYAGGGLESIGFLFMALSKPRPERIPFLPLVPTATILVLGVFVMSAQMGQDDRYMAYSKAKADRSICGGSAILRRFSDDYLAVEPNGTKAIINKECKIVFSIPEPRWLVEKRAQEARRKKRGGIIAAPPHVTAGPA